MLLINDSQYFLMLQLPISLADQYRIGVKLIAIRKQRQEFPDIIIIP